MDQPAPPADDQLVSAADIARIAGVTRAAVSNWRRRHPDFPAPAAGTRSNALFALGTVRTWLEAQDKSQEQAEDVQLWDVLRSLYGDDMVGGMVAVAELLAEGEGGGGGPAGGSDALDPRIAEPARRMATSTSAADVVAALAARYPQAARRTATDGVTSAGLVGAVARFAEGGAATVFDPACGIGSLLAAVGDTGAQRSGQDSDPDAARFARLRLELEKERAADVRVGDSLREDRWPGHTAELVVCHPPAPGSDWGREELLLDPRWELGVPPRTESELAWLQHAYAHTAPGGQAVVVMSASAAYRRPGRRIRAELVRRGVLTGVVALPPGLATSHPQSVHLWLLRRAEDAEEATGAAPIRLVDLTGSDLGGALEAGEHEHVDVSPIDLLDDAVDLTPAQHITGEPVDYAAEYRAAREELEQLLDDLGAALPALAAGSPASDVPQVRVSELAKAGFVEFSGDWPVSVSDKLDTDFLHGFLLSPHNTRRSISASGTFRADVHGARIPQAGIEEQRRLGAAFRAVAEFEAHAKRLAEQAEQAASLARSGLATGALGPKEDPSAEER